MPACVSASAKASRASLVIRSKTDSTQQGAFYFEIANLLLIQFHNINNSLRFNRRLLLFLARYSFKHIVDFIVITGEGFRAGDYHFICGNIREVHLVSGVVCEILNE